MFLAFWSANWRKGVPLAGKKGAVNPGQMRTGKWIALRIDRHPFWARQVDHPVDRWTTSVPTDWAFITPLNIEICIDMLYPVDRWNECEGVIIIPWSAGPLAKRLANG
jgi:hypothetical protein